jgi:phosphoglycerate dehydrogenase-like enzyme
MANKPVVIVDPHFRQMSEIFAPADLARLRELVEVVWGQDQPMPVETAQAAMAEAVAVVSTDWRYGDSYKQAPNLRVIISVSGGFPRYLDYDYCFANRIRVLSVAPAFARPVAEMALGMALAAGREIVAGDRAMRAGEERWGRESNTEAFMLYDQPVGLIGFGNLAQALCPLLAPFGCSLSVYDPWLGDSYLRSQGVTPRPLEQLLAESKVIFVLAAVSVENQALLSRELLQHIQPGAVLVLISRAHVVDFEALTEFVLAGRFKAAIDVFPVEPLPLDHPIRNVPGAILSAHRAGPTAGGLWDIGRRVTDDLEAIVRGLPPQRLQVAQPELVGRLPLNKPPGHLRSSPG